LDFLEFNQGLIRKSFSLALLHQKPYKRNQIGFSPFLLLPSYRELRRRLRVEAPPPSVPRRPAPSRQTAMREIRCRAAGEGSAAAGEEEDGAVRSGPSWSGKKKMGRRRRPEMGGAAGWRGAARGVASTTDGEDGDADVSQPGWSGSVRQILREESNPHLRGIFSFGANPTLLISIQTAIGAGSLHPNPQPNTR